MQYCWSRFFLQYMLAVSLFLCCSVCAIAQPISNLDSLVQRMVEKAGNAGLAVAVVKKDSVVYARGFGYRDYERRLPVTPETVFPIGSCTKAMTAALIGSLPQKISLDVPVQHYLPALRFYNTAMNEQITVRDLLCHRSGLPRHEYSWFYMVAGSRDSMLRRVAFLEPNARIGEKWQYNNWGYLLLGMLAEKVSGSSYEAAVHQYLLQPLQMRRSYFSLDSLQQDKEAALGYRSVDATVKKVPYHTMQVMAPAGGLNSTVLDIARWLSCWIKGNKIIPASFRSQAIASQMITKAAMPSNDQAGTYFSNYGFGWFLTSYRGHYRVEHGGNIDGFTSTACFYPTDSLGIIVLCNRDGSLLPALVRNAVTDHFLQLPVTDRTAAIKQNNNSQSPEKSSFPEFIPTTHPLPAYTGFYEHPGYGRISIVQRGDSLFAQMGAFLWWLWPQQYDTFRGVELTAGERPDGKGARLLVQFHMHPNGYIESLSIPFEPTVAPLRFMKQVIAQPQAGQEFTTYMGSYLFTGETIYISLNDDDNLYWLESSKESYRLLPLEENVFMLSGLKGNSIRFTKDKRGVVTGFWLQQPNGVFRGERIK